MARKGKSSSIRYRSNRNYDFYSNGQIDKSKLTKRELKEYERNHKEKEEFPKRYRKKVNGAWVIIEKN